MRLHAAYEAFKPFMDMDNFYKMSHVVSDDRNDNHDNHNYIRFVYQDSEPSYATYVLLDGNEDEIAVMLSDLSTLKDNDMCKKLFVNPHVRYTYEEVQEDTAKHNGDEHIVNMRLNYSAYLNYLMREYRVDYIRDAIRSNGLRDFYDRE